MEIEQEPPRRIGNLEGGHLVLSSAGDNSQDTETKYHDDLLDDFHRSLREEWFQLMVSANDPAQAGRGSIVSYCQPRRDPGLA